MYRIYVHTFPDGKKYVGCTSLDVENRWQSGRGYKDQKEMFKAIKSVGWNNIQHQVIETVEDKETAIKREEYYTLLWRTNEPEFGYNIFVGYKNDDIRKKISETNRKPIKLKNKNTGEIFMFDSQKSCAKFFGVSNAHIYRFIKGKRQIKFFSDYKVLK